MPIQSVIICLIILDIIVLAAVILWLGKRNKGKVVAVTAFVALSDLMWEIMRKQSTINRIILEAQVAVKSTETAQQLYHELRTSSEMIVDTTLFIESSLDKIGMHKDLTPQQLLIQREAAGVAERIKNGVARS